ncbi:hypothetical protein K461DRAFT_219101 [Myriangium duriaei CBS 260.36]|uniref:Uncharacterized protein n=1 Tax=Myriangium duriaei CBS 260.36 TaxID=1168546 RepID=A0A9P4MSG4_9PEZI|nr:hypothetical protein K461DRAFT_219101 [Myriangium duriaei CBS 260.36]
MRDRRNTNLSISTASFPSNNNSPVDAPNTDATDLAEKGRFLLLPLRTDDTALPSPLLKHQQELQARQPAYRRYLSSTARPSVIFALFLGLFFFWRCLAVTSSLSLPAFTSTPSSNAPFHVAPLSSEPGPIIVQDSSGRKRWTVSIPENSTFPLRPSQYRNICSQGHQISKTVRESIRQSSRITNAAGRVGDSFYAPDSTYIEVHDAIKQGLLNSTPQAPIPVIAKDEHATATCDRSLTFILETEEAGFGKSLLSLWLSYSLARRERRAFFIDDSRWQYGDYLSFFPKPPNPSCLPPPPSQVVPCPHQAAHLAVSAATLSEIFGSKFHAHYLSSRRSGLGKQKNIFHMAREGYEALFALTGEDAAFAKQRISSIRNAASNGHYPAIGMHVRRGDRHPFEYEFHHDYLPLHRFTAAAAHIIASTPRPKTVNASEPIPLLIASDNPDIPIDPDLAESTEMPIRLERAQDRIVLASKRNLNQNEPERQGNGAFVKHVDEVSGWEGGFFASLFRGLGRPNRAHHLTFSSAREHPEDNAAVMRHLVGRGYLLDLEVLGRGSDDVVCAVSSATCRVLAVIMGWDKVKRGQWVNVDDGRGWSWDGQH